MTTDDRVSQVFRSHCVVGDTLLQSVCETAPLFSASVSPSFLLAHCRGGGCCVTGFF